MSKIFKEKKGGAGKVIRKERKRERRGKWGKTRTLRDRSELQNWNET